MALACAFSQLTAERAAVHQHHHQRLAGRRRRLAPERSSGAGSRGWCGRRPRSRARSTGISSPSRRLVMPTTATTTSASCAAATAAGSGASFTGAQMSCAAGSPPVRRAVVDVELQRLALLQVDPAEIGCRRTSARRVRPPTDHACVSVGLDAEAIVAGLGRDEEPVQRTLTTACPRPAAGTSFAVQVDIGLDARHERRRLRLDASPSTYSAAQPGLPLGRGEHRGGHRVAPVRQELRARHVGDLRAGKRGLQPLEHADGVRRRAVIIAAAARRSGRRADRPPAIASRACSGSTPSFFSSTIDFLGQLQRQCAMRGAVELALRRSSSRGPSPADRTCRGGCAR